MNTPPGNPYEQGAPGPAPESSNPYLNQRTTAPAPDLDAAAPSLRTEEQQRLNRKALLFLGGIVLLLMAMAFLVFAGMGDDEEAATVTEEAVDIPALADEAAPPPPPVDPAVAMDPAAQYVEPVPLAPPLQIQEPQPYVRSPPPAPDTGAGRLSPPSLLERRMGVDPAAVGAPAGADVMAMQPGLPGAMPPGASSGSTTPEVRRTSAQFLRGPDTLLVQGTFLRCVLATRIVSDVEGFTSCVLTEPAYSVNGRRLLLPKGSRIIGSYKSQNEGDRLAVVWDRLITPTGIDVALTSPGVDSLGGAGVPGHVNNHWPSKIASALLISLISDAFKYAAAENGPPTTTVGNGFVAQSPFESNTARTIDRLANDSVSKSIRRPATIVVNQGAVVAVYVAQDVDFSNVMASR